MRHLLSFICAALFAGAAFAEEPQVVVPEGQIFLGVGQILTLRFESIVERIDITGKGTVDPIPQSDHQFSLQGIAAGATPMFVYGQNGVRLYSAVVTVSPEPGRPVKVYGFTGLTDFITLTCSPTACGHADKDPPKSTPTTFTVTRPLSGGGYVTSTMNPP
jgi:hypothetical protein